MATMANLYRDPRSTITTHHDTYPYISPSKFTGSLKDKVILLTGAGRGIGRASALAFAASGANVACISRTPSDTLSLVQEISQKGYPRAIAIAADVVDPDAPRRVVGEVQRELGSVDVLVNNAGISRISDVEHEQGMEAAMKVFDVNVRGTLDFIHAVVPSMIRKKSGVIINVSSFSLATGTVSMQAEERSGCLRPRYYLSALLLSVQLRKGISGTLYTNYGSRVPAPWHLLIRCASVYEQGYNAGRRRAELGSSRKGGWIEEFHGKFRAKYDGYRTIAGGHFCNTGCGSGCEIHEWEIYRLDTRFGNDSRRG